MFNPWFIAAGSSFVAYCLVKSQKGSSAKLRTAKIDLLEQQRTIDRLRAELGRERHQRQEEEKAPEKSPVEGSE